MQGKDFLEMEICRVKIHTKILLIICMASHNVREKKDNCRWHGGDSVVNARGTLSHSVTYLLEH